MNIILKNIGIIKESSIAIDGLTVIAGKNNSGKTTVGKALYALIDGTSDIRQKAERDQRSYIIRTLIKLGGMLYSLFGDVMDKMEKYDSLSYLLSKRFDPTDLKLNEFSHSLYDELKSINLNEISRLNPRAFHRDDTSIENNDFQQIASMYISKAVSTLDTMFANLEKNSDLLLYSRLCTEKALRTEFAGQIQPVRAAGLRSEIQLVSEGETYVLIEIENNRVVSKSRIFNNTSITNAYMIDDPFIVDGRSFIPGSRTPRHDEDNDSAQIIGTGRYPSHGEKLSRLLHGRVDPSIFEMTLLDEKLRLVHEKIEAVLPCQFEFSSDGDYYVQNGAKLQVSNLATGSKIFSIIKILLDKGKLDESTLLILDEPEAHLHPQWQNAFAEIIVLLVKELGVKVLLTTHSPNFMLAIDAFMRKYTLNQQTNFYQTMATEDGFVNYKCVNDDLELIYGDFVQYLAEVKALRDRYFFNAGDTE